MQTGLGRGVELATWEASVETSILSSVSFTLTKLSKDRASSVLGSRSWEGWAGRDDDGGAAGRDRGVRRAAPREGRAPSWSSGRAGSGAGARTAGRGHSPPGGGRAPLPGRGGETKAAAETMTARRRRPTTSGGFVVRVVSEAGVLRAGGGGRGTEPLGDP
ncbi:hypothetical protein THAOC_26545, partial [Thalassiosira oceanica]